jgi:hypothetical protein
MKYLQIVHKFGCIGYSLLALVCAFLLVPISFFVFRTGDERLIAAVATAEVAVISLIAPFVVVYWRNPGLLMSAAVWVPIYFVTYLAVLVSYNFDGYLLSENPHFSQWGVFFLSLLLYQIPVLVLHAVRQRRAR